MCKAITIHITDLELKESLREEEVIDSDTLFEKFGECSCCLESNVAMKAYVLSKIADAVEYLFKSGFVGNVIVEVF